MTLYGLQDKALDAIERDPTAIKFIKKEHKDYIKMAEIALKANIDNQSLIAPEMMPKVEFSLFKAALAKNDSLAKYIN